MVRRRGGNRRKTRHLAKKPVEKRGKISIRKTLQDIKLGEKVVLKMEPGIQKGIYFRRFHGRTGVVKEKKGNSYKVEVKDGNKIKTITARAVHLNRVGGK